MVEIKLLTSRIRTRLILEGRIRIRSISDRIHDTSGNEAGIQAYDGKIKKLTVRRKGI